MRCGRLVAHDRAFVQFTKFSRTGLTVSRLCLGTGTFGKQTDEAESFRVYDKASDAVVNFIDTADVPRWG
jgi:1-deoxyxylulose-5-phosphate synthase